MPPTGRHSEIFSQETVPIHQAIYEQNTYPSFFPRQNGRFGMVMSFRFLRTGLDHVDQADQANKVEVPTIILGMLESPGFQTYSTQ